MKISRKGFVCDCCYNVNIASLSYEVRGKILRFMGNKLNNIRLDTEKDALKAVKEHATKLSLDILKDVI